jgi:hypothetical protein
VVIDKLTDLARAQRISEQQAYDLLGHMLDIERQSEPEGPQPGVLQ